MKKQMKQGFTLVEIMIVVAIIGLLAAIAIPSFVKSRDNTRKNACINNLRQIDSAKEQWAMDNNIAGGTAANDTQINLYMKEAPVCPGSGTYTYEAVGTPPSCSLSASGHTL